MFSSHKIIHILTLRVTMKISEPIALESAGSADSTRWRLDRPSDQPNRRNLVDLEVIQVLMKAPTAGIRRVERGS
jgi:hypothetical protein